MPVIALDTIPKLTVETMDWGVNQARTLRAFHAVKKDSLSALAIGAEVSFTDTDLGYVFFGKIVDVQRAWRKGEGVAYNCADVYRKIVKTAATVLVSGKKTGKLAIQDGTTLSAALTKVTQSVDADFPSGVLCDVVGTMPGMDKGGQSIDTWIDDLLKQTRGAVAYVEPNAGSPRLRVVDYYGATAVYLTEGTYNIQTPTTANPLIVEGTLGESLNGRYKSLLWEGAGCFQRYRDVQLGTVYPPSPVKAADHYKFYVPGKPVKRYIEAGSCKDAFKARIRIGGVTGPTFTIYNPSIAKDGTGYYFSLYIAAKNLITGESQEVIGWFDYTLYTGPLTVTATNSDARLEGEQLEIHDEYFKYTDGANSIDHSAAMQDRVDAQFINVDNVDFSGVVSVHVKGLNPNLRIGSELANFAAPRPRVRSISYDFQKRNMILSVSNSPIRTELNNAKQLAREKTLRGSENWHQNKLTTNPLDVNCFSGWKEADGDPLSTDNQRSGYPDSWTTPRQRFSMVNGSCQESEGGEFGSLEACNDQARGFFYCVDKDKSICMAAASAGGSISIDLCAVNCTPAGVGSNRYVCFPDGCRQVFTANSSDGYATLQDCCQGCAQEAAKGPCGGGTVQNKNHSCSDNPIKKVITNDLGQVMGVECITPLNKTVVTNVTCNAGTITVTTETIKVLP